MHSLARALSPETQSGTGRWHVRTVFRSLGWEHTPTEPNENGIWFAGMERSLGNTV